MDPGIPVDGAAMLSTILEAILYGFSLLMFIGVMWILTSNGRSASNRLMISIAIVLFVLSTAHVVVDIVRIEQGLVKYRNTFPGGPPGFFADVAQNTYLAKSAFYLCQTLVGDGVVIYRCYIVWRSIWIIVLPLMLWCSVAATGIGILHNISQAIASIGTSTVFGNGNSQWITAYFASTLTTNLLSSGLLAYRIWTIERNVASLRASNNTLKPVLHVVIDAALLYSVTLFVTLVCFVIPNNGQYVLLDMIMPIISIAFYMVLIRIGMTRLDKRYASTMLGATPPVGPQGTAGGMKPLQVHISHFSGNDAIPAHLLRNQDVESNPQSLKWEPRCVSHAT